MLSADAQIVTRCGDSEHRLSITVEDGAPTGAGGGVGTPDGGAGGPGTGAPGTPGGGIAGRGRLLAAIALLVLVALGLWVVFGDDGAPPEPADGTGTATATATATA